MSEFKAIVRKLYLEGYSQKTIVSMVKDLFDQFRRLGNE